MLTCNIRLYPEKSRDLFVRFHLLSDAFAFGQESKTSLRPVRITATNQFRHLTNHQNKLLSVTSLYITRMNTDLIWIAIITSPI